MRKLLPLTVVAIASSVVNLALAVITPGFLPATIALAAATAIVAIWWIRRRRPRGPPQLAPSEEPRHDGT